MGSEGLYPGYLLDKTQNLGRIKGGLTKGGCELFKKRDIEQNRRVEGSKGKKQPKHEVTLAMEHRTKLFMERIADNPNITPDDFAALLIDPLGLEQGSPTYLLYMKRFLKFRS